jgi:hypothetical protein
VSGGGLVRWGFAHAPMVMANEAHSGLARCVRTREVRVRMIQPDMQRLIGAALGLGWTLWAYEAVIDVTPDTGQEHMRSIEFTNWREREQAANLGRLVDAAPDEPLLVWCGNSHASTVEHDGCDGVDALVVSTGNEMTA